MKSLKLLSGCVALGIVWTFVSVAEVPTPIVPDQRDQRVLDALLLHLLADSGFDLTTVPTSRAQIVLNVRTPEKTGFLQPDQICGDIGSHTLPSGVERDLRRRNSKSDAKPDTYESVPVFFTNLTFSSG